MRAKDAFWATLANVSQQLFSFITMLVVARLLEPALFGVIATAMLLVLALQRVLLESIGYAIIQKEDLKASYLNTAFISSVVGGTILAALLFFSADWIAKSFAEPRLLYPLKALCLLVLFDAFATIPMGILRREFQFKSLAVRTFIANVISGVVGITMAYSGMGIWSLVGQQVTASFGSLVVLWLFSKWRPRLQWSNSEFRSLCTFGLPMVGNALFMVVVNRMDVLLLSASAGAAVTGLYSLSKRIVRAVTDLIISGVINVSLSSLSTLKNDHERRDAFLKDKIGLTAFIAYPIFFGLAVLAPILIPLVIGEKWLTSIPIIQVLCGFGVLQLLILYGTNILVSAGHSKQLLIFNATGTLLLFILISIGLSWGGLGVALAFLGQAALSLFALFLILKIRLNIRASVFIFPTLTPALCSFLMLVSVSVFFALVSGTEPMYLIIYGFLISVTSYSLFSLLFSRKQILVLSDFLKKNLAFKKL